MAAQPAIDAAQVELEIMRRELSWLLETTVPSLVAQLTILLKEGLVCCSSVEGGSPTVLAVSSANTDAVKGFVTVNGTSVSKAEVKLKLPNYKSQLLAYNLAKPLTLYQLQDARNYVSLALNTLDSLTPSMYHRARLIDICEKILDTIKRAINSLCHLDEKATFPLKECDTKAFTPELPEDLIVEFFINRSVLVVSVTALHSQNKLLNRLKAGTGRSYKYREKNVEAVEEILVECPYPKLATLLGNLTAAEDICSSLLGRLSVLPDAAS